MVLHLIVLFFYLVEMMHRCRPQARRFSLRRVTDWTLILVVVSLLGRAFDAVFWIYNSNYGHYQDVWAVYPQFVTSVILGPNASRLCTSSCES